MEKHEGITRRNSTRWCVLSGIQELQYKGDPSTFKSLNIKYTISITTIINGIQATASGKGTRQ